MKSNKNILSEEQLVSGLSQGDTEVFSCLYDQYSGALFGIIKRIIDDNEIAADVLQDSFIKIWEKRSTYDSSKGRLFTWMLNITRNTSIDASRSKHVKAASKIRNLENNVGIVNKQYATTQLTDVIDMNHLVDKLPEEQKRVLELQYFKGYTQEEVAKHLDIPLGTVKTRTRNGLIALRQNYNSPQP